MKLFFFASVLLACVLAEEIEFEERDCAYHIGYAVSSDESAYYYEYFGYDNRNEVSTGSGHYVGMKVYNGSGALVKTDIVRCDIKDGEGLCKLISTNSSGCFDDTFVDYQEFLPFLPESIDAIDSQPYTDDDKCSDGSCTNYTENLDEDKSYYITDQNRRLLKVFSESMVVSVSYDTPVDTHVFDVHSCTEQTSSPISITCPDYLDNISPERELPCSYHLALTTNGEKKDVYAFNYEQVMKISDNNGYFLLRCDLGNGTCLAKNTTSTCVVNPDASYSIVTEALFFFYRFFDYSTNVYPTEENCPDDPSKTCKRYCNAYSLNECFVIDDSTGSKKLVKYIDENSVETVVTYYQDDVTAEDFADVSCDEKKKIPAPDPVDGCGGGHHQDSSHTRSNFVRAVPLPCAFHLGVEATMPFVPVPIKLDVIGINTFSDDSSFKIKGVTGENLTRCDVRDGEERCFFQTISGDSCNVSYVDEDDAIGQALFFTTLIIQYNESEYPVATACPTGGVCMKYCYDTTCVFVDSNGRYAYVDYKGVKVTITYYDDVPTAADFAPLKCNTTSIPPLVDYCAGKFAVFKPAPLDCDFHFTVTDRRKLTVDFYGYGLNTVKPVVFGVGSDNTSETILVRCDVDEKGLCYVKQNSSDDGCFDDYAASASALFVLSSLTYATYSFSYNSTVYPQKMPCPMKNDTTCSYYVDVLETDAVATDEKGRIVGFRNVMGDFLIGYPDGKPTLDMFATKSCDKKKDIPAPSDPCKEPVTPSSSKATSSKTPGPVPGTSSSKASIASASVVKATFAIVLAAIVVALL